MLGLYKFPMNRVVLCAFFLGASLACDRPSQSKRATTADRAARPDSVTPLVDTQATIVPPGRSSPASPRGPLETLGTYLAGSVFRRPTVLPDSLDWCPEPDPTAENQEGWEPDTWIAIAQPRVLGFAWSPVDTSGQSRYVAAEVLRLAMIYRSGGGWVASVDVKPDTLVWTMLRRPSGAWAVCGPAAPLRAGPESGELYFLTTEEFAHRGEINGARWQPPEASWDGLARLADTLHAAH
jgi:hypothetical protein